MGKQEKTNRSTTNGLAEGREKKKKSHYTYIYIFTQNFEFKTQQENLNFKNY